MEGKDFLHLLKHSKCLIGNSSVGIRECAYLGVPAVNIGSRQNRRERGDNVVDVKYEVSVIQQAILERCSSTKSHSNVYGDGATGNKIAEFTGHFAFAISQNNNVLMKVLAIIPARGGSKGVPGKNIKMLGDKPFIAYTIEQAIASGVFSKIIVSTDSEQIKEIGLQFGAEVPFIRPEELASDTASSISVVQHAVDFFENQKEYFDAICLLQPTSPFREKGFINKAIEKFIHKKTDCLLSVLQVPHEYNPHWTFLENENGTLGIATGEKEIIKRRQDLPVSFF